MAISENPLSTPDLRPEEAIQKAVAVFDLEIKALADLRDRLDTRFFHACKLLQETVTTGRKIVILGVGKSGQVGEKLCATLNSTGASSVVLSALNALHGDLGVVSENDLVVALSQSGETDELLNVLPALKRLPVRMIALTGNKSSTLARLADVVLDTHVEREACPLNLAPTASSTAMMVLGDALAMVLLEMRNFRPEDFARFHPGGKLGRVLLLKVSEVMRGANRLPILSSTATVLEAVREMNRLKSGAAALIDSRGRLAGIFTHGDFVRAYEAGGDLSGRLVADIMSRDPVTVPIESLAVEILKVLERANVDDLLVVDSENRPVGIVDSQDLARSRLM